MTEIINSGKMQCIYAECMWQTLSKMETRLNGHLLWSIHKLNGKRVCM